MNYVRHWSLTLLLASPQLLIAAEQAEHRYTPKEQISFAPETTLAFDYSGERHTHSVLADGSQYADHNGSMGNVTVARLNADGTIETFCTSNEAVAKAWMAGEDGKKPSTFLNAPVMEK